MVEKFEFVNEYGAVNGIQAQELDAAINPILDRVEEFGMNSTITPREWAYLRAAIVSLFVAQPNDEYAQEEILFESSEASRANLTICLKLASQLHSAMWSRIGKWLAWSVIDNDDDDAECEVWHNVMLVKEYVLSSLNAVCAEVQVRKAMSLRRSGLAPTRE